MPTLPPEWSDILPLTELMEDWPIIYGQHHTHCIGGWPELGHVLSHVAHHPFHDECRWPPARSRATSRLVVPNQVDAPSFGMMPILSSAIRLSFTEQVPHSSQEITVMAVGNLPTLLQLANHDASMYVDSIGEPLNCSA